MNPKLQARYRGTVTSLKSLLYVINVLKYKTVNTPWCRILFEKLIATQLVKNILLSYGTRRFITVFTKARHWTLS
jgi:hypothetical protein